LALETVGICSGIYGLCDNVVVMSHYAASIGKMILKQSILLEGVRTETVLA